MSLVESISFVFIPSSDNEEILQVSDTAYLSSVGGVITPIGFSNPAVSTNGNCVYVEFDAIEASNVQVGASPVGYFNGTIKDLYIHNRTLTQAEITKNYEQPEQFYIDALADDTCVLNMPMCDTDSYARDYSEYSEVNLLTSITTDGGSSFIGGVLTLFQNSGNDFGLTDVAVNSGDYVVLEYEVLSNDFLVGDSLFIGNSENTIYQSIPSLTVGKKKIIVKVTFASNLMFTVRHELGGKSIAIDNIRISIPSGIHPITNATADCKVSNLPYGTQNLKLPHDDLGLRDGTITPWIKGDGVGYSAASDLSTLGAGDFTVEVILNHIPTATSGWEWLFESGDGLNSRFILATQANKIRGCMGAWFTDIVTSTTQILNEGLNHIVLGRADGIGFAYANSISDGIGQSIPGSFSTGTSTLLKSGSNISSNEIRLFKVHQKALTQEEVTTAFQDAQAKGLLAW